METHTNKLKAALDAAIAILNKATSEIAEAEAVHRIAEADKTTGRFNVHAHAFRVADTDQTNKLTLTSGPSSTVARARAILDKLNGERAAKAAAATALNLSSTDFGVTKGFFGRVETADAVATARKAIADTGLIVHVQRGGKPGKMIARDQSSQLGADLALIYNALAAIDLDGGLQ